MSQTFRVADLFCGAGGTSLGCMQAVRAMGAELDLVAVNHWDTAIATHTRNHPLARHYCINLDAANPVAIVEGGRLDLLLASPECFPAGTLILTESGFVPIENVAIGDRVLTHQGRWQPVTAVMSDEKDTVIVRGQGHYGLETTADHPFLAVRRTMAHRKGTLGTYRFGEPQWVKASNLTEKHVWATPTHSESVTVPQVGGRGMDFDVPFWWMVGRWLGDGSVRVRSGHGEITIACGKHEADELEQRLMAVIPIDRRARYDELRWRRREIRTAELFETDHKGLADWLVEHFGKLAHGKTIPAWALTMWRPWREALLAGYVSADGSRAGRKVRTSTVSKRLAVGLRLLVESLGYRASLTLARRADVVRTLEGRVLNERPQWRVDWLEGLERRGGSETPMHSWRKIRRVDVGRERVQVFNLSVAEDESYVADGIVVHNCTHFSRARGGKPVSDQRRASAYHVQRWVMALNGEIDRILIENVREFMEWGPLGPDFKIRTEDKGRYFFAWVNSLVQMGYDWDWRVINAADYGDATTRERLFIQFVKHGLGGVRWPQPTHSKSAGKRTAMFAAGKLKPWRAAREVIDWQDSGRSLLDDPKYRARPLSIKTRMRIARGLARFGGPLAQLYIDLLGIDPAEVAIAPGRGQKPQPFLLSQQSGGAPRSADEPVSTIAAAGYVTVVSPFLIGQHTNNIPKGVDEAPVPCIPTAARIRLIEPMLAPYYGSGSGETCQSVTEPVPTIPTRDRFALVDAMAVPYGPRAGARSVAEPLPTVMTSDRLGVAMPTVEPFIVSRQGHNDPNGRVRPVSHPLSTITGSGSGTGYLVEPFIVPQFGERDGQAPRVHNVGDPLPSVTSHGAGALVQPVVIQTDQTGSSGAGVRSVDVPLPTVVTKQTMAVVEPLLSAVGSGDVDPRRVVLVDGQPYLLDIRFRMLKNRELARAMGFDDAESEYEFSGTATEVTRQIGNAVCVHLAAALITAVLGDQVATGVDAA